ncbi:uncharacterized protein LOC110668883 isoform X1 [Hevea brasiliensis]|uniref:uncharacterized protein LOC110668883 isoform X1 n=1 Tax=Hevea brasiliensis TaxID=3981 RepID=UPI0025D5D20B|nr:uncharacterized protein LOC110668883 isoform X1 [Hevea brasiliensis]XP_021685963.2 uncharacterized protein LOC110668883 isoform X1 [Hevea brasiliensis]
MGSMILMRESEVPLIYETTRQSGQRFGEMDIHHHHHPVEDVEFWPVEHPMEPQDEDRPVRCPIPTSSFVNDGSISEQRCGESLRKRADVPAAVNKEGIVIVAAEPPLRAVRKRHHTLTHGNHITRMPHLPPLPTQNVTIFQMLQQLDEFEC